MIHKIIPSDFNWWLNRLVTQLNEPTNQIHWRLKQKTTQYPPYNHRFFAIINFELNATEIKKKGCFPKNLKKII